jgi:hypothetical protein
MEMSHYKSAIMGLLLSAVFIFAVPLGGYAGAQDAAQTADSNDSSVDNNNDVIIGTEDDDTITLEEGGYDYANGLDGEDVITKLETDT